MCSYAPVRGRELELMILLGSFQIKIFYDSSALHHKLKETASGEVFFYLNPVKGKTIGRRRTGLFF